jgi:homoserine O-acetyltransferase
MSATVRSTARLARRAALPPQHTRSLHRARVSNRTHRRVTAPEGDELCRNHAATAWHRTVLEHTVRKEFRTKRGDGGHDVPQSGGVSQDAFSSEYASPLDASGQTHTVPELVLESGRRMQDVEVRYRTWGQLNDARDNVIVVCHALTGNADAASWWSEVVGPGKPLDTNKYFVFCANALGSCYGTCGPRSQDPATGLPYGGRFPLVTVRDSVRLHAQVLDGIGVTEVTAAIGGSMGGMQALEWTFLESDAKRGLRVPNLPVRSAVAMACNGRHNPWQIGFSECQRQAIFADPNWLGGDYGENPPSIGLGVARQMAMVSYRTHNSYLTKFGRRIQNGANATKIEDRTVGQQFGPDGSTGEAFSMEKEDFAVESYLRYQGASFVNRGFDPSAYVTLTHLMDSHDVSRGRGKYTDVLNSVQQPVMVLGIKSDVLYPEHEQKELRDYLSNAEYHVIESDEGHDGFLLEQMHIGPLLQRFLSRIEGERGYLESGALRRTVETLDERVRELEAKVLLLATAGSVSGVETKLQVQGSL